MGACLSVGSLVREESFQCVAQQLKRALWGGKKREGRQIKAHPDQEVIVLQHLHIGTDT